MSDQIEYNPFENQNGNKIYYSTTTLYKSHILDSECTSYLMVSYIDVIDFETTSWMEVERLREITITSSFYWAEAGRMSLLAEKAILTTSWCAVYAFAIKQGGHQEFEIGVVYKVDQKWVFVAYSISRIYIKSSRRSLRQKAKWLKSQIFRWLNKT